MSVIEDALADAERGITMNELLDLFGRGPDRRDVSDVRLFLSALSSVLGHAAVAEIDLDGVETYVRTDSEFFREGIEPVGPPEGLTTYRTKGAD